jgi:DNA/RNA-binding domain of Phe-tRNA-synthetase-like protein
MEIREEDIILDPFFSQTWPGAHVGILAISRSESGGDSDLLISTISKVTDTLKLRFPDKKTLNNSSTIRAYRDYYKRFKKTYHVIAQIESVLFMGKEILGRIPLVSAMFTAEIKNMLLTAGHDLDRIDLPVTISAASGSKSYTSISGKDITPKTGDMLIRDRIAILSSVIYGPDRRTRIRPETASALFTVYAPAGIPVENIKKHLADILNFSRLIFPGANKLLEYVY